MAGYFVTASGTEIGKTLVTTALVWQLTRQGRAVRALKPVITGFDPNDMATSDSGVILESLGEDVTLANVERISPWRFADPISPDMAAAREGTEIEFGDLFAFCHEQIVAAESDGATLLIEGIGGVMVPLTDRETVTDWMAALGLPAILVTGSYLGSLSHTLTALEALGSRGVTTAAVVVSESPENPVPLEETIETIRRFVEPALVRSVPRLENAVQPWTSVPDLTDIVSVTLPTM